MSKLKRPNESEQQLEDFLKNIDGSGTAIRLYPQGDNTLIGEGATNLCVVTVSVEGRLDKHYTFGGISEDWYDLMYENYDYE